MRIVKKYAISLFLIFSMSHVQAGAFKTEQMKNARVKNAYAKHAERLGKELSDSTGISFSDLQILLVGYKLERELQIFVKKKSDKKFSFFKTIPFCYLSGTLGPKRKEGDLQVPEGLYYVNWFNPGSNYHLSMKINYPNASDKILSDKKTPGGEIFIHGDCVSIGCIPLMDDPVEELYILAVEASDHGQQKIPVYLFPCKMDESNMNLLSYFYATDSEKLIFWRNLKLAYDHFLSNQEVINFKVDATGKYVVIGK